MERPADAPPKSRTRVNVYVDGFNLYYRALKSTRFKWLDVKKMAELYMGSLSRPEIHRVRYFTAEVSARAHNPDQPTRQRTYLRALRTIPNLTIHLGHFAEHIESRPRADGTGNVRVIVCDEKGSDVNLATYLLLDGAKGDYDAAFLVSNDSDLAEPVRLARTELGRDIYVLDPHVEHKHRSKQLYAAVGAPKFYKKLRHGPLSISQFPDLMSDADGAFHKPSTW
jgi:uncharacterized LabA/DUF88 family protein